MAQLKDLIVNGASRLIGDAFTNKIQITTVNAPTASGSSTYGPGSSGQVLKTNGTSIYWDSAGGAGTVTQVTAGTGLKIGTASSGGTITTTGTINHINSVTAQTTQAVYPIKIDAQGHISAYGSAVTSMPASDVYSWAKASSKPTYTASEVGALASNTTYVSTITTTAGAHTAISNKSGAISFNVPTTAAHVGAATSDHVHGNITNGGDITATAPTIANGDQIVINDASASKITNGPTFDGSTTTKALTPKGTWETFLKSYTESDPVFTASAAYGITSSDITNWNNKSSTDTKVTQTPLGANKTVYPLFTTTTQSGTVTDTATYSNDIWYMSSSHEFGVFTQTGVTIIGPGYISIAGNSYGVNITPETLTYNRTITLPNKTGTVALITDLPTNISSLTNDVGYISSSTTSKIWAQTTAPTSGMAAGDIWIDTSGLS